MAVARHSSLAGRARAGELGVQGGAHAARASRHCHRSGRAHGTHMSAALPASCRCPPPRTIPLLCSSSPSQTSLPFRPSPACARWAKFVGMPPRTRTTPGLRAPAAASSDLPMVDEEMAAHASGAARAEPAAAQRAAAGAPPCYHVVDVRRPRGLARGLRAAASALCWRRLSSQPHHSFKNALRIPMCTENR